MPVQKSLDQKIARILADRGCRDFILADAKDADAGHEGLGKISARRVQAGQDTEYERVLSDYLAKLVDMRTDRIEMPPEATALQSSEVLL